MTARGSLLQPAPPAPAHPPASWGKRRKIQAERCQAKTEGAHPAPPLQILQKTLTREAKPLEICPQTMVPGWGRRKARPVSSLEPTWHQHRRSQGRGCSPCCKSLRSFPFQGLGEFISSAISEDACLARDCFAELRKIRKWLAGSSVEEGRIA